MERKTVEEFVKFQLDAFDYSHGFEYLDSLQKLEMVMICEKEYNIAINEDDITHDYDTNMFVDLVCDKIKNKPYTY